MADLADRAARLLARVKRKREEVERYLDARYYRSCRDILQRAEAMDADGAFRRDPSGLPEYHAHVRRSVCWTMIGKRIATYKYATPQDFMEDMRLVVENCYAYNGHDSKFSAQARTIEVYMEDAFVKELGEAPPSRVEMLALSKKLPPSASPQILKVFARYEKQDAKATDSKVHISLSTCRCATKRRILELMRNIIDQRAKATARKPAALIPVKRAPQPITTKRVAAPAAGAADANAHQPSLAQVGDDLNFHQEQAGAAQSGTNLERVPQNVRTDEFALRDLSPARLDESLSDSESESGSNSGSSSSSASPSSQGQDSDFAPLPAEEVHALQAASRASSASAGPQSSLPPPPPSPPEPEAQAGETKDDDEGLAFHEDA